MSSLVEWCWQKSDLNKFKEKKKQEVRNWRDLVETTLLRCFVEKVSRSMPKG